MYLKHLELIGFKSFADRTKLDFEPGMTAIVGPNGCGKSNIADSIRWVLGEQSAKALRGAKMEDCIFNGADTHKPMGMAEVSMTFADCEKVLGTEYNEITVTRRVFRDGEGSYFINKTPCRLKDIQRLFMDTGIGTDSYSILEQGRIDQILSSRPEDRREVFEEASGITKFKADKKEAIRKLEHTEANLLRLADIIREVRRQIISLQRQAGKARRYQVIQEQLRGLDLFATRDRMQIYDRDLAQLETRVADFTRQEETLRAEMAETERQASENRAALSAAEQAIAQAMEASMRARTDLDRARELIQVNEDRIRELQTLSDRDRHDADEARQRLEQHRSSLEELGRQLAEAVSARDAAERDLQARQSDLAAHEERLSATRQFLHDLSTELIDIESRTSRLQNELYDLEAGERTATLRRERLAAEQAELRHSVDIYAARQEEMNGSLGALRDEVGALQGRHDGRAAAKESGARQLADTLKTLSELKARLAAREAQVEMLDRPEARLDGLPGGARALLEPPADWNVRAGAVLGALTDHLQPEPACRVALEAALRTGLDALVVSDKAAAADLLGELVRRAAGAARLLPLAVSAPGPDPWPGGPGRPLADQVRCPPEWRPAVERLLRGVRVVDALPGPDTDIPPGATLVTPGGAVRRGNGLVEFWMPGAHEITPLARRAYLEDWTRELADLRRQHAEGDLQASRLRDDIAAAEADEAALRRQLEERRHALAQREGEQHIITQEADQARQRADTVAWEWQSLQEQTSSGAERKNAIHAELERYRARQAEIRAGTAAKNDELRALENERTEKADAVTNARVGHAERRQAAEHMAERQKPLQARIQEIEELIRTRSEDLVSYRARIGDLERQLAETKTRLLPMEEEVARQAAHLDAARKRREEALAAVGIWDKRLHEQRANMDDLRNRKGQVDVELAEQRVRRQNLVERAMAEYHITLDLLAAAPEPAWENGQRPDREAMETQIAELRAKLESMGPVNLVAIEEYKQHEERHDFLTRQQDDLVNAKQQLLDFIRRINQTTTEMFSQTFNQVNTNFQDMFQKLFGGGTAKLVLVDEGDVLESGIEIIARPPGKKLQTVSLLSGGERTMTAVALLFSLYMVKPSPFCLLDELDAALDEANIGRFIKVVQGFLESSQFIVITHNRQTIGAADILYGVTMEHQGVSKIVSVKFSHHEKAKPPASPAPKAEPAPAAEPVAPVPAETSTVSPAPPEPAAGEIPPPAP